jgi:hypothetical protein
MTALARPLQVVPLSKSAYATARTEQAPRAIASPSPPAFIGHDVRTSSQVYDYALPRVRADMWWQMHRCQCFACLTSYVTVECNSPRRLVLPQMLGSVGSGPCAAFEVVLPRGSLGQSATENGIYRWLTVTADRRPRAP